MIGGNAINLGRGDEINVYDARDVLVDRLTYDDAGVGDVAGPAHRQLERLGDAAGAGQEHRQRLDQVDRSATPRARGSTRLADFFGSPGISNFGYDAGRAPETASCSTR